MHAENLSIKKWLICLRKGDRDRMCLCAFDCWHSVGWNCCLISLFSCRKHTQQRRNYTNNIICFRKRNVWFFSLIRKMCAARVLVRTNTQQRKQCLQIPNGSQSIFRYIFCDASIFSRLLPAMFFQCSCKFLFHFICYSDSTYFQRLFACTRLNWYRYF